jgi:membrane protease YdiL (CAAX protease family)
MTTADRVKQMAAGMPNDIEIASEWGPILAFIVLANAVTWLACLLLRSTFAAGHLWALFTFVFVTVWSPTVIALALSFSFEGTSGVRNLLGLLFRRLSKNNLWYLIGILVPVAAVASAIVIARYLHSGAPFLPLAALPLTLGLQVFTGAMGEELGWRGFLLSHLERRLKVMGWRRAYSPFDFHDHHSGRTLQGFGHFHFGSVKGEDLPLTGSHEHFHLSSG